MFTLIIILSSCLFTKLVFSPAFLADYTVIFKGWGTQDKLHESNFESSSYMRALWRWHCVGLKRDGRLTYTPSLIIPPPPRMKRCRVFLGPGFATWWPDKFPGSHRWSSKTLPPGIPKAPWRSRVSTWHLRIEIAKPKRIFKDDNVIWRKR